MLDRRDVTLCYDGTPDGLMCVIFYCYERGVMPFSVITDKGLSLMPVERVLTDVRKADRVINGIKKAAGQAAYDKIRLAMLTGWPEKEINVLKYVALLLAEGKKAMYMQQEDCVSGIETHVRHLINEGHRYKEFIRFSVYGNLLYAKINPKNQVLPLIVNHFKQRFPEENFLIYDATNAQAAVYRPYSCEILYEVNIKESDVDETELYYRRLWKTFYDAIEIKQRHNERCRMSCMPKRYWSNMPEFK